MSIFNNNIKFYIALFISALAFVKLYAFTGGGQRTFTIFAGLCAFLYICRYEKDHVFELTINTFFLVIYTLFSYLMWNSGGGVDEAFRLFVNAISCISLYVFGSSIGYSFDIIKKNKLIFLVIALAYILSAVDAVFRFYFPEYSVSKFGGLDVLNGRSWGFDEDNFHTYKWGSIMFFDSNYVAIYLAILLFMVMYSKLNFTFKYYLCILSIGFLLLILSFGRSAWLVVMFWVFSLFLIKTFPQIFGSKYSFMLIIVLFVSYLFFNWSSVYDVLAADESGDSKLEILRAISGVTGADINNSMLGYGFDAGWHAYSYRPGEFAHNILSILVGQVGIVGAIVYVAYLVYIASKGVISTVYVIGLSALGMSLLDPWDGCLFWVAGICSFTDIVGPRTQWGTSRSTYSPPPT